MPNWFALLTQVHNWVVAQSTVLRVASYLLGGFSLIFGGKALGRFLNFTQKGGFYSSLLVGIPAGACYAALTYAEDILTNHTLSRLYTSAFHYSFSTQSLALLGGLVTMLVMVSNPNAYRIREEYRSYALTEAILVTVTSIAGTILLVYFESYYVFVVLGWLGAIFPPVWAIALYALACGSGVAWLTVKYVTKPSSDATSDAAQDTSADKQSTPVAVIGCLALLLCIPAYAALFVITGSLVIRFGWVMVIFLVVSAVLGGLIYLARYVADQLDRSRLLQIFAIPGAIAIVLQFAVNNVSYLPH